MRRRMQLDEIVGRVNTANGGILAASEEFGAYSGGTGIVQIWLPKDFRLISVVATPVNASAAQITIDTLAATSFLIRTFTPAGSAAVGVQATFIAKGYR